MYSEKVMDHFTNPRNVGELENASGVGTVGNAKCGDIMRIYLDVDDNQIIRDVKFKTFGCGCCCSNQQHGDGAGKGQDDLRSSAGYEQGGYGSSGWIAARKGTLFSAGGGSHSCGSLGLCHEEQH